MHNFLSRDGTPPAELLAAGRDEVAGYGGEVVDGRVDAASPGRRAFVRRTGRRPRRTGAAGCWSRPGLVDELPDVPGLAERWGRDVLHCPYCHGWEVRDQRIGVLATGPMAVHQAQLWRQWSPHVTAPAAPGPRVRTPDEAEQLARAEITVVDGAVARSGRRDDRLTGVRLASAETVELDAVVVAPRFAARTEVLASLGLTTTEVDRRRQATGSRPTRPAPRPFPACGGGNVADVRAQVIAAAAAGLTAGAAINVDLILEEASRRTYPDHSGPRS